MNILKNAQEHWVGRLDEVRIIEVPEWGDETGPAKIYVKPANLLVRDKIFKYAKDGSLVSLAASLVMRAMTEQGARVWQPTESVINNVAKTVDPDVLARVVLEINEDLDIDMEEKIEDEIKN